MAGVKLRRDRGETPRKGIHVAQGKPVARRGRKARGLPQTAQPPTSTLRRGYRGHGHGGPEMPYIIRPRRVYRFATTLLAAASLSVAVPAVASAYCPTE